MINHHFISYPKVAKDFAIKLSDALQAGPPSFPVWLDERNLQPGRDWDEQIADAIRTCDSLLFVMTKDSVEDRSICKLEWTRALKYKKPVVPLLLECDADAPFRLANRQYIDFTVAFEQALSKLRIYLQWLASPEGTLQGLKDRLTDAERDLRRTQDLMQQARIKDEIELLKKEIENKQRIIANPEDAEKRVKESIERGLERERQPEKPISGVTHTKFINPPPGVAPNYFQDRHVETKLIGDFLKNDSQRLMTIVGRAGMGKTAMVCRLLKSLESGQLPDNGGELSVDGIIYLSETGTRKVNSPNLYADLCRLLPDDIAKGLDEVYKNPKASAEAKMQALLAAFPQGRVVLLLDNFENLIDTKTRNINNAEMDEALRAILNLPHAVKIILTTRVAPRDLALVHPERQTRLDLDKGLESPYAEKILREMDADGIVGLQNAPDKLLNEARERTQGNPRALEALFAILSADRDTSLPEILNDTKRLLPEYVLEILVGEAFSRLDSAAQQVMQALAIYAHPVTPVAVDYLLQQYLKGVDSALVLNRLVNMQFVRKETGGAYYMHPVDRAYALSRIPMGNVADREETENPLFTQFALLHRGAEYFKQARMPREKWKTIGDLAPQLAEFDLRCAGQDYDTAANVLLDIDFDYLLLWGHYRLVIELHQRLEGKLSDLWTRQGSTGNLGNAYYNVGEYRKAIEYYEKALIIAKEIRNRGDEGTLLGNLGAAYGDLGQVEKAIEYCEKALIIAKEIRDRGGEGRHLGNLGAAYSYLGQVEKAIEYHEKALIIAKEIRDRRRESIDYADLGDSFVDQYEWNKAVRLYNQAISIADEIKNVKTQNEARFGLALAYLCAGNLQDARSTIETANSYDFPPNNHNVLALLGVITLRQRDITAAQKAFTAAIESAETMLNNNEQNYNALDAKGLTLCGLALCKEDKRYITDAINAYKAAREINKYAGVVGRVLRLFDELAKADSKGLLVEVRTLLHQYHAGSNSG